MSTIPPERSPIRPVTAEPILAEGVYEPIRPGEQIYYIVPTQRRVVLPVLLFITTAAATFWAGATGSTPDGPLDLLQFPFDPLEVVFRACEGWRDGLTYMLAVMAILLAHEMGHFLQALRYRVPASLPYFIPMAITPLGTMGAVIAMRGNQADRRELFDIGLTGPIAGLLIALPVTWIAIIQGTTVGPPMYFNDPLIIQWLIAWLRPDLQPGESLAWSPLYLAGWVGMLITGLNMMPISQLDGGHVAYALLGRRAHWLARGLVMAAVVFIMAQNAYGWIIMLALVVYMGTDHPRTANDRAPLGWWRYVLGWASLVIPVLCFVPVPIGE
ncbi:MAG TPA: site-2 protease family protein [Pirellulales bacterium]|nr:site-2 protease family protein [Pirellulales bacterium]